MGVFLYKISVAQVSNSSHKRQATPHIQFCLCTGVWKKTIPGETEAMYNLLILSKATP